MDTRRLVKAGQTSHTISLPKAWINKLGLKKGDNVYINQEQNNDLTISPQLKEEHQEAKRIEIDTTNKPIDKIQREITSAYINNYNTIIIRGKGIETEAKEIRKIIQDFVALETVEQTAVRIVAKDLLNPKEISVEKTLRRMDLIVRSLFQDTKESIQGKDLQESIHLRDQDINRLYFLMFRILKGSLSNQKFAKTFNIQNHEALGAWYVTVNLENMADTIKNTGKEIKKVKNKKDLQEQYTTIEQEYLKVIKAYHNKDKDLANAVISNRKNIIKELFNNKNNTVEIITSMKELETFICNIARSVMDN